MAKQLNSESRINLVFDADTRKAKAAIEELNSALRAVAKLPGSASSLFDDTEIKKASQAALELEQHLARAMNVNTGKLDLSRFSSSLKAANKDLNVYYQTLLSAGPTGQQAFMAIASAISKAEMPTARVSAKMQEFLTTLKNTARWQISSSILHGFMGSLQTAYNYAQDLNESLNNIRIVTGQSVDEMADFAKTANKAAKALSTTTTEYTNAALIFYQQGGFSEEEIQKRTEATIKMANVSRQSAEIVSDQMTAIWNNFYDGSKSLEYYADVITKLGAETASSSDEIAQGLEKFAAISQTVGLSYEYATSALATVTAQTRQSADVVGTAFKTLFARIQDLELGKTLDDGVTLGKYSEALNSVGISILDQHGNLREMDDILDDMGDKWGSLTKAQQTSLAQTVAGTRQYTQLVALMDNWSAFKKNLETAKNSSGALQEQADIYAESWEAAQDRVTAAAEAIYDELINDEFFIDFLNVVEKILQGVKGLIDGFGGLEGVLTTVGTVFMTQYAKKMPEALNHLKQNFMVFSGQAEKEMLAVSQLTRANLQAQLDKTNKTQLSQGGMPSAQSMEYEKQIKLLEMKEKLTQASDRLTEQEKEAYQAKMENVAATYDEIEALIAKRQELEQQLKQQTKGASQEAGRHVQTQFKNYFDLESQVDEQATKVAAAEASGDADEWVKETYVLEGLQAKAQEAEQALVKLAQAYNLTESDITLAFGPNTQDLEAQGAALQKVEAAINAVVNQYQQAVTEQSNLTDLTNSIEAQADAWESLLPSVENNDYAAKELTKTMLRYLDTLDDIAKTESIDGAADDIDNLRTKIKAAKKPTKELLDQLRGLGATNIDGKAVEKGFGGALNAANEQVEELDEKMDGLSFPKEPRTEIQGTATKMADLNTQTRVSTENVRQLGAESPNAAFKMSQAFTEAGASIMATYALVNSVKSAIQVFGDHSASGFEKVGAAISMAMAGLSAFNAVQALATTLSKKDNIAQGAKVVFAKLHANMKKKETAATVAQTGAQGASTTATWADVVAKIAQQAAMAPVLAITLLLIAAMAALAAVILIVVGVTKAISDAYNADKIAAQEAAKAVEELSAAYENAKNKAEEFKTATSSYEDSIEAIGELTKGTKEYYDAIDEANEKTKAMIETYGLFGQWHYGDDGLIEINKGVLEDRQAQYERQSRAAENKMLGAKIYSNQQSLEYQATQLERSKDLKSYNKEEVQWVANAISNVDNASAYGNGALARKIYDQGAFDELGLTLAEVTAMLQADRDGLLEFADSMEQATAANNEYAKSIIANEVEDEYGDQIASAVTDEEGNVDEGLYNQIINAAATRAAETENALGQSLSEQIAAIDIGKKADTNNKLNKNYGYSVENDEDLARTYAKTVLGMSDEEVRKLDYKAGNNKGTLKDANGNAVLDQVSDDYMRQQLAIQAEINRLTQEYQEKVGAATAESDAYITALSNMASTAIQFGEEYGADFAGAIVGAISNGVTDIDFESLYADLSPAEHAELLKLAENPQELMTALGLTPELLAQTGWGTAEQFAAAFSQGLQGWAEEDYTAKANREGEQAAQTAGLDVEEYKVYRDLLLDTNEAYRDNVEGLNDVALANLKAEKAVANLGKNWSSYSKVLKKTNATNEELAAVLPSVNKELKNMLNLSDNDFSFLPADFAQKHWDLLNDVMEGTEGSLEALRNEASKEILVNITANKDLGAEAEAALNALHAKLAEYDSASFEVGVEINDAAFKTACDDILATAKMTKDEAQAYFAGLGYDAELEERKHTSTTTRHIEYPVLDENGNPTGESKTFTLKEIAETTVWGVKTITPSGSYGGGIGVNTTTSSSGSGNGGGGGGDRRKTTKRGTDSRYSEIDDALDDTREIITDINRELDKAYGASRVKEIEKLLKLYEKEVKLLEQKKEAAEGFLIKDTQALSDAASATGVALTLDGNGNITNFNSAMDGLYGQLNAKEAEMQAIQDRSGDTSAVEEEIKKLEELISTLEAAADQYNETKEYIEDLDNEIAEKRDAILEENYNKITVIFELKAELNEGDLKRIERQISSLGEDFFARAEVAAAKSGYATVYEDALSGLRSYEEELHKMHEAEEISTADYIAGLKTVQDGYAENIDKLREWKAEMKEYYKDTLETGDSLFQQNLDFIRHSGEVLEYYDSLLDLAGGEKDYSAKATIYEGLEQIKADEVASQKAYYNLLQEEADKQKAQLANYAPGSEAYEAQKQEWLAAQTLANQAQSDLLAATQEWGEAVRKVLENEFESYKSTLEKALTNGTSFDSINTAMERAKSLSEEWLDNTNKIYETNKLMRTAQTALDKTTNVAAQKRLKAFIDETKQMQEQDQLSKTELEIRQAQYDLLLAEIALEEAQNAKSTVRLQRDSAGNFGYVYTADQDKVGDAQQKYEDADNKLYNLGLEKYEEYTEKYMKTQQEFYEAMTELDYKYYVEKSITEEEYNQAKLEMEEYYYTKLADYTYLAQAGVMAQSFEQFQSFKDDWFRRKSELDTTYKGQEQLLYQDLVNYAKAFNIELGEQNTIRQTSWATTFDNMKLTGEEWDKAMATYSSNVQTSASEYQTKMEEVGDAVDLSLHDTTLMAKELEDQVKYVKDESKAFREELIGTDGQGGLVKALGDEYDAVDKVTSAIYNQLDDIGALERAYESWWADIQTVIDKLLELQQVESGGDPDTPGTTPPGDTIIGDTAPPKTPSDPPNKPSDPSPVVSSRYSYRNNQGEYAIPKPDLVAVAQDAWRDGESGGMTTIVAIGGNDLRVTDRTPLAHMGVAADYADDPTPPEAPKTTTGYYGGGGGGGGHASQVAVMFDDHGTGYRLGFNSFDTGGYTGSWGPEGRMAMLHQKELVLNAKDTENMLAMVDMVRNIVATPPYQNMLGNMTSPLLKNLGGDSLEQHVMIEASFPNVTQRTEIEAAFNNLINTASQYANRKRI